MVRYTLSSEVKYLYNSRTLRSEEGGCVKVPVTAGIKFVDILNVSDDNMTMLVRVHCPNGDVIKGWMLHSKVNGSIQLFNEEELFDGRFNSDKQ